MNRDDEHSLPQLLMRHPSLKDLPPLPTLPAPYVLRSYRREEANSLAVLLQDAFERPWTSTQLKRELTEDESVKAIYVVDLMGKIAATGSARIQFSTYPDAGYVHYIAVASDVRGKRLGEIVVLKVLSYFQAMELQSAVLETDDFRIAALRLYLKLGFVPEYRHPLDQQRWSAIFRQLYSPRQSLT